VPLSAWVETKWGENSRRDRHHWCWNFGVTIRTGVGRFIVTLAFKEAGFREHVDFLLNYRALVAVTTTMLYREQCLLTGSRSPLTTMQSISLLLATVVNLNTQASPRDYVLCHCH
jgi:hypothetical protein